MAEWKKNTGRRPVGNGVRVDVKFNNGEVCEGQAAGAWYWLEAEGEPYCIAEWKEHEE